MPGDSAYQPLRPARRPGGRPESKPQYRVLVHRKFFRHWERLVDQVGIQQAQQLWDHLAESANQVPSTANSCLLRGKAGRPQGEGWSRTVHYEVSSKARVDYQYHNAFATAPGQEPHPIVAILTINFSSH